MKPLAFIFVVAATAGCGATTALDEDRGIVPRFDLDGGANLFGDPLEGGGSGGGGGSGSAEGGGGSSGPPCELPACSWPASIDPPAISNVGWSVNRTLVVCGEGPNATPAGSNDPSIACDTSGGCVNACAPHEYLVSEAIMPHGHGVPMMPPLVYPRLPSGCASPVPLIASPVAAYYCCPCL
jgi:hypothetical protein